MTSPSSPSKTTDIGVRLPEILPDEREVFSQRVLRTHSLPADLSRTQINVSTNTFQSSRLQNSQVSIVTSARPTFYAVVFAAKYHLRARKNTNVRHEFRVRTTVLLLAIVCGLVDVHIQIKRVEWAKLDGRSIALLLLVLLLLRERTIRNASNYAIIHGNENLIEQRVLVSPVSINLSFNIPPMHRGKQSFHIYL